MVVEDKLIQPESKIYRVRKSLGFRLLHIVFGLYFLVTLVVTLIQLSSEYLHVRQKVIEELYIVVQKSNLEAVAL